ncbi:preprotein translocase subunit YajC [Fodinisporobacter ferrooxydans]|uniref:Preprotein translocase subunit YajC n=1 Tax=Fodinisporobacter ferrooxydans TaxID=2901836 RepID=A0ABY4CRX4_9BACL|nr:preprotein translocase subunit YajC [Alicyclobacillaceae bacterium MYW30-H2]
MSSTVVQFLPLILLFVVFYFILIRPQQRNQKKRTAMLSTLKKGDQVVTIGGINGTITDIDDEKVTLRVSETSRIVFERSSISSVKVQASEK